MPFRRPVGAAADVKELEYVPALHQTCLPICRENATVSSIDVARYLRSRFALKMPHKHALGIIRSLGGGVIGEDAINRILEEMYEEDQVDLEGEQTDEARDRLRFLKGAGKGVGKGVGAVKKRLLKAESERIIQQAKEEQFADELAEEEEGEIDDPNEDVENPDDLPEEYLDLVQLLSIILIPTLARAGKEFRDGVNGSSHEQDEEDAQEVEELSSSSWNPFAMHRKRKAERRVLKVKRKKEEQESLRPKPESIIQDVLAIMLRTLNEQPDTEETNHSESTGAPPTVSAEHW